LRFGEDEPEPLSVTVALTATFWLAPATAIGGAFEVVIATVEGALLRKPLLTISWATYCPGTSTMNVGFALFGLTSAAALPVGNVMSDHEYVKGRF
jgi:hypothetical protein